jgi:hypothetical protein
MTRNELIIHVPAPMMMTFILLLLGPIPEVQIRSGGFKMAGSQGNRSLHIYTGGSSADMDHQLAAAEREAGEGDLHMAGSPLLPSV